MPATPIVGVEALDSVIPAKTQTGEQATPESCQSAVAQAIPEIVMSLLFGRKVMVNSSYVADSPTAIELVGALLATRPNIDQVHWSPSDHGPDSPGLFDTPYQPFWFGELEQKSYGEILFEHWAKSEDGAFHSSAWGDDSDAMRRTVTAARSVDDRAQVLYLASDTLGRHIERLPVGFTLGHLHAVGDEYDRLKSQNYLRKPDFTHAPALGDAVAWLESRPEPFALRHGLDPAEFLPLQRAASQFIDYLKSIGAWKQTLSRTYCHGPQHVAALSEVMSPDELVGLREFVDTCYNHVVNQSLGAGSPMMSEPVTSRHQRLADTAELAAYLWIGWLDNTLDGATPEEPRDAPSPIAYPKELTHPASVDGLCQAVWEILGSNDWYQSFRRVHEADRLLRDRSSDKRDDWKQKNYDDKITEHANKVASLIARYGRGAIWSQPGSIAIAIQKGGGTVGGAGAGARMAGLFINPMQPVAGVLSLAAGMARTIAIGGTTAGRVYDGSIRRRRILTATKVYAEDLMKVAKPTNAPQEATTSIHLADPPSDPTSQVDSRSGGDKAT